MKMRQTTEGRAWLIEQLGAARARCLRACDAGDVEGAAAAVATAVLLVAVFRRFGCPGWVEEDLVDLLEVVRS